MESISPPKSFDRAQFEKCMRVVAIKLPSRFCNGLMKAMKHTDFLLDIPKVKRIIPTGVENEDEQRLVLLSPDRVNSLETQTWPAELVSALPPSESVDNMDRPWSTQWHTFNIGYDNYNAEAVLRLLLPNGAEIPNSFEQIGSIAHLNIRDELLHYRYIIGQVILEKNSGIRTVVNKVGVIESEFRTLPLEVIAGVEDFSVSVRECGAEYQFSFKDVYWNSRLGTEHARLVSLIADQHPHGCVVADMMAGVGPFAVPLGMKQTFRIHANDLNPASYASLVENAIRNGCNVDPALAVGMSTSVSKSQKRKLSRPVERHSFVPYNLDGRDFIINLARPNANQAVVAANEVILNLPATAVEFLDVFIGYRRRYNAEGGIIPLPRIHVYAFSNAADPVNDVVERVAAVLQCDVTAIHSEIDNRTVGGHIVRDVAPNKLMICLSFVLPRVVADAEPTVDFSSRYPAPAGTDADVAREDRQDSCPKRTK